MNTSRVGHAESLHVRFQMTSFENPANKPSKFTEASIFYPGFVLLQARETRSFWSLEFASIMDVTADCKPGESPVFRGVSGTTTWHRQKKEV